MFSFYFVRVHHNQIVSNQVLLDTIDELRKNTKTQIGEMKVITTLLITVESLSLSMNKREAGHVPRVPRKSSSVLFGES